MRDKNKREGGEEKLDGGVKRRGKTTIKVESRLISPRDLGAHLWVHTDEPPPPKVGNRGNPNMNL